MKKTERKTKRMSVYANLAHKRRTKKDASSRKRAEYLATLPKHPVKRFFYRLHPKRVFAYWFSKRGLLTGLKIVGIAALVMILFVGGLFAYYRKDLDKIRPGEIAKRVQTTVTKYYDRNGELLWEDKGTGNYKLVVDSKDINDYLKKATVAIEDRDFYKHHGVSVSGLTRALVTNASGGQVQGGSTLTQQLVKQVFFAEEAGERGIKGIPRKIKEIILAIEVERMYDKDQILTLYLNESPYGGRRNGAESASQTYFGKSAKNLSLPEAALLAAIPQNPSVFNPYNPDGHKALINRQHTVLNYMAQQGYVTQKEADEAIKYPILDNIKPLSDQLSDIKAPHFVLMVRSQLEKELGKSVVGRGGLTVKTTLDLRIQQKLEQETKDFFESGRPAAANISNTASTVEDVNTGQIVALVGSRDFNYPGFGQDNAATAYIQPGSTIKPFVYAELFKDKGNGQQNYGSGSILKDENIDRVYGAQLRNWDNRFMGNITIRQSLALSRNIPAVKAMYINGIENTIGTIHKMGNANYCKPEKDATGGVFLSSAIGACGSREVDLVNAYGTLARMGTERPSTSILEVKNNQGETLKKWKDESKNVIDPQVAYIITDILADPQASAALHGYGALTVPGVRTATKTGTSDRDSKPKDLWISTYSPVLSMSMWLGNSDTSTIGSVNSAYGMPVVRNVMQFAHQEVYAKDGRWNSNMWFNRPGGLQQVGRELYPSWWNKSQGRSSEKLTFDRVSKKKATQCTPDGAREEIDVFKSIDPITKSPVYTAPDGYDATKEDDVHDCSDAKPKISGISVSGGSGDSYTIEFNVSNGKFSLATVDVLVDGRTVKNIDVGASGGKLSVVTTVTTPGKHTVTINVRDQAYYTASASANFNASGGSNGNGNDNGNN